MSATPARPPPALRELQDEFTGRRFDAEIAAAGQAVILAATDASPAAYEARAWGRRLRRRPRPDPKLRDVRRGVAGRGRPKPCA